ncbi:MULTISPECIES: lipopolysaccharide assembly LapA domain-containing protein [unclassified Corynebacterium]|uniref:LapA family protein n=1 Tax=unclassified Corynebacterium TaxID=2624378 RepID=UPI0029CA905A|nr:MULTISPECIES: lipopolysaccharide assembly protein LapA domain-containing protein [unclassified Corynebacterium]WPF65324.1 lipopolysaccharide assembly protein LapA domain-containing protein [Corynebacterium sp. 22KM0430]WPF67819.1 lipopolysaccharide assembly protein LapA domain-containing protein [Corynebacterium sp. 21KM1197]
MATHTDPTDNTFDAPAEATKNTETTAPAAPPKASQSASAKPQRTFAATTWAALIVGALLLILLLVFIMQNQQSVELTLFAWKFSFPAGVGFLLAAIAGALIMALVGGVRMLELRRIAKKNSR